MAAASATTSQLAATRRRQEAIGLAFVSLASRARMTASGLPRRPRTRGRLAWRGLASGRDRCAGLLRRLVIGRIGACLRLFGLSRVRAAAPDHPAGVGPHQLGAL